MRRALFAMAVLAATAAPAAAAHWTVDAAKSKLGFSVDWGGEPFTGTFKKWTADIDFDPADLAHSHVAAVIEIKSEASDDPDSDESLKGAIGFAADKFPAAKFETTGFKALPGGNYLAQGKLTIRGVTKPVDLPFKLDIQAGRAHMTGKVVVIRTDFGVGQGEWASPKPVAHEVTVTVDLTATKG
jgi:polyisoprenoid-binding protein YceI